VITYRPPDAGVPTVQPAGTIVPTAVPPPPPVDQIPTTPSGHSRAKPLLSHIGKGRLVHRTTLQLSFVLSARAYVQLIGRRHGRVVAETRRRRLSAGRHTVSLRLNPRRWPTALALKVAAA